jgi:8-oxo-dGTP pyrophosphatase MutT (NUDIX family)
VKQFNVGIKGVVTRSDGSVLLLKKNQEKPFWEVPGGRIDNDESIEQTLERELHEELPGSTNIEVKRILCAHRLPHDIAKDLSLMLIYFEVRVDLPDPIEISDEHSEYVWVTSLDELPLDGGTYKSLKIVFDQS